MILVIDVVVVALRGGEGSCAATISVPMPPTDRRQCYFVRL
jgi:hypothetical protein